MNLCVDINNTFHDVGNIPQTLASILKKMGVLDPLGLSVNTTTNDYCADLIGFEKFKSEISDCNQYGLNSARYTNCLSQHFNCFDPNTTLHISCENNTLVVEKALVTTPQALRSGLSVQRAELPLPLVFGFLVVEIASKLAIELSPQYIPGLVAGYAVEKMIEPQSRMAKLALAVADIITGIGLFVFSGVIEGWSVTFPTSAALAYMTLDTLAFLTKATGTGLVMYGLYLGAKHFIYEPLRDWILD